jgi:hypothetical protein
MSDADLREALLGTWRLIRHPFWGENPQGYLAYTPDGYVFVQTATRERRELFGPSAHGPVLLDTTEASTALGFTGYCGTFEVRDGQVIHRMEFNYLRPSLNGSVEPRSVTLDGDRLVLGTPRYGGAELEWQRVHSAENR